MLVVTSYFHFTYTYSPAIRANYAICIEYNNTHEDTIRIMHGVRSLGWTHPMKIVYIAYNIRLSLGLTIPITTLTKLLHVLGQQKLASRNSIVQYFHAHHYNTLDIDEFICVSATSDYFDPPIVEWEMPRAIVVSKEPNRG